MRKSRLPSAKPSMLPRKVSTDRLSSDRRPSSVAHRSSSTDPRATNGRLSRESSATKVNKRSRSQQGESRFNQSSMTPLRSTQYRVRPTTPRTPSSQDRGYNWETSLDRVLGFVTIKDQRPLTNPAWQRAELSRVQAVLTVRGGPTMALIRPLTIARFVEIVAHFLMEINGEIKLNSDNYITKLPYLLKRVLYPGTVSKSWLQTVNTLHAFPHALACIGYLMDVVTLLERPMPDRWYIDRDELGALRREYLAQWWQRFQLSDPVMTDLDEMYLNDLKELFGNDDAKISELEGVVKHIYAGDGKPSDLDSFLKPFVTEMEQLEQGLILNTAHDSNEEKIIHVKLRAFICDSPARAMIKELKDQVEEEEDKEKLVRADEVRRVERYASCAAALRAERASHMATLAELDVQRATKKDHVEINHALDVEIERANAELEQLRRELECQEMSVAERTKLLDQIDYANRVQDSKRALAEQIAKMVLSKERKLASWQQMALASCMEHNQGLIHLAAESPVMAALQVDEKELMEAECGARVLSSIELLKAEVARLTELKADKLKSRSAAARRRHQMLEDARAKVCELRASLRREQQALDSEVAKENADAHAWAQQEQEMSARIESLQGYREEHASALTELQFWEKQDQAWKSKLSELRSYVETKRADCARTLQDAKMKRVKLVMDNMRLWKDKLKECQKKE